MYVYVNVNVVVGVIGDACVGVDAGVGVDVYVDVILM